MKAIPDWMYEVVEERLTAQEATVSQGLYPQISWSGMPGGRGRIHRPTEKAAMRRVDEPQWACVCEETWQFFQHDPALKLKEVLFVPGGTIQQAAGRLGLSRKTVAGMKDAIVYHCALVAIREGLLDRKKAE